MAVAETPDSLLSGNDQHKQAAIKLGWKEGNIPEMHRDVWEHAMRAVPLVESKVSIA